MLDQALRFQLGDQVVHRSYGLGTIIKIEEKELSGNTCKYYVVKVSDMTLWVSTDEEGERSLRCPATQEEFQGLFDILSAPGEPLSDDRFERHNQVTGRLKSGMIETICRLVRDLTIYKRNKKVNEDDTAALHRAKNFLLREWSYTMSIPLSQADQDLTEMLKG
jgi:CarD family transcriptional regulator